MAVHIVRVELSAEEEKLVKAMLKEDIYGGHTVNEVLANVLYLQLREDMDTLHDELVGGGK